MIKIEERRANKLPTGTSLYLSFNYNQKIVDIVKNTTTNVYNKTTNEWEVPINNLAYLVNALCCIDDLQLSFLPEIKHKKKDTTTYKLSTYNVKPFDYQIEGIQYGLNHDKWLLLDVPGLGKSLQSSIIAKEIQKRDKIKHCLIICGINTLKFNWKNEINKYFNEDVYILGQRIKKDGSIKIGSMQDRINDLKKPIKEFFIVTNIETLRDNDIVKLINQNKSNPIDMIILDEAHVTKNPTSQQGKNLLKLNKAKYKIAMTGTLLLNDPMDCYVPLKWIEREHATYTNFKYYYCKFGGLFGNDLIGYQNIDDLKDTLSDCSLRRTKDILDLPPKTIIDEYVDMNSAQAEFYEHLVEGEISQVDLVHMSTANLLAMMSRLRQATACPSILTSENIKSSKQERAIDLTEQMMSNGEKVVIFSTFKQTANELFERLKKYNPVLCTGDVSDSDININKNKFQNDADCRVFIGTWQKCGTGITLTAATNMIFLDTPWTDGVYEQAQDRIHRVGTKAPVTIYNLIAKGTVDERVLEIVNDKAALSDYIIDNEITQKGIDSLRKYIMEIKC